jgi:hypothetical protein
VSRHPVIAGVYDITFTIPFAGRPAVTATISPIGAGGVGFTDIWISTLAEAGTVGVRLYDGSPKSETFSFIAIGPR